MIRYKNSSNIPLTFYGVTFNPNEIKEVPGFINHIKMIRVKEVPSTPIKPRAIITKPKQEEPKPVEVKKKRTYTKRKQT